jgi:hypothetical protein
MSGDGTVTLPERSTPPAAPAAGKVKYYVVGGTLYAIDEGGIITQVGGGDATKAVRNESGAALTKGKAVYVSGYSIAAGLSLVDLADKDDPAKRPAVGVVRADIPNNSNGELAVISTVTGIDTSAFALTDQLVLGTNGALSRPPPDEDPFTGEIQNLAVVSRVGTTDGEITVIVDGLNAVTAAQIFALAGTDGAPGPANKYVTNSDPRLSAVAFDPRDLQVFDHFISGNIDTDETASYGWRSSFTGTSNSQEIIAETGHPGILRQSPGTTAAGRSAFFMGGETNLANWLLSGTQGEIRTEWLVRFNAAALLAANNERSVFGFGTDFEAGGGTEQADGVYVEFNPGVSANFLLRTASATIRSQVITTIPVVADTWYRIEIRITYPGGVPTAEIFINGTTRGTLTTTFPTVSVGIGMRVDANAGAGYFMDMDYVQVKQVTNKET